MLSYPTLKTIYNLISNFFKGGICKFTMCINYLSWQLTSDTKFLMFDKKEKLSYYFMNCLFHQLYFRLEWFIWLKLPHMMYILNLSIWSWILNVKLQACNAFVRDHVDSNSFLYKDSSCAVLVSMVVWLSQINRQEESEGIEWHLMLCLGPINNMCSLLILFNLLKYFNVTHLPLLTTPIV